MLAMILGLALVAWLGAMGVGALLKTEGSRRWFVTQQGTPESVLPLIGVGFVVTAIVILLGLFGVVSTGIFRIALIAVFASQIGAILSQLSKKAPMASLAGPIVLAVLSGLSWMMS